MPRHRTPLHKNQYDASDSVSELSNDESSVVSNMSKSSAFRSKLRGKFGRKKGGGTSDTASVGSRSRASAAPRTPGSGGGTVASGAKAAPSGSRSIDGGGGRSARSGGASKAAASSGPTDQKRLIKDAKSRFNIGLVYLKTADYAKAQDNLEHSLYCHIQLNGHNSKKYSNDTLFAVAGVREKLGECYLANAAVVDKCLALDHYDEARRLLRSVDPEDAPDNLKEMLERVEEQLKRPELGGGAAKSRRPPKVTSKYQQEGNKKAKALMGVGAGTGAVAAVGSRGGGRAGTVSPRRKRESTFDAIDVLGIGKTGIGKGLKKGVDFVANVADDVVDGIHDVFDSSSDDDSRGSSLSGKDADAFAMAMSHLDRDNHRTALNYLSNMQEAASMKDEDFRAEMAFCMLRVADGAFEGKKISVATDAYEEAYSVLKQDGAGGENMERATRGCIKCHKSLAMETEGMRDYSSAIGHRSRVCQLLEEGNKVVPTACQLLRVGYLHGIKEDYAKGAVVLSDAVRALFRGFKSVDGMPQERVDLIIKCYQMRAIFYSKSKKWNEASHQYEELLSVIAKTKGQGGKEYNLALIHQAALLVTMGNHRAAHTTINKYLQLAELSDEIAGKLIVDDLDHVLALDTCAATYLKMGNVDKAIAIFEQKLKFVKTLPNCDEMKSDTMHKLGCLMACKNQHKIALPMLDEALNTRKYLYDGKHKFVYESTWAVAATNHTLGDNTKALKEYGVLLEKMSSVQDNPVDSVLVHNSAGKLLFEDGKFDQAAHSFNMALRGSQSSHNPQLKAEITLSLANVLSARGETDKAFELYDELLSTKSLKRTKLFYLVLFNKSLLLIKIGEVEEAKEIFDKILGTKSSMANDVKGSIYMTKGNIAITDGKINEALVFFEKALDTAEEDDVSAYVQAKKNMANAYLKGGQSDKAITTLEDVLEDLSGIDEEGKVVDLLKAEIWNTMSRVYKKKGDLSQAKNYAKLALGTYKSELGENNPVTLRNVSNLQLILLEEAEDLPKGDAKSIIDAAKYEIEGTLDAFESLNDTWTYRLDVASLKTNLALVSIWQGKPKKAKKLMRQIQEIEIPPEHSLVHRVEVLEGRLQALEKKKGK